MPRAERGGTEQALPVSIDSYNKHMGGVRAVLINLLSPYDCTRRLVKWYRKLAEHLIQLTVLNPWNLHRCIQWRKANDDRGNFIAEPSMNENLLHLTGRHFIEQVPATAKGRPQKALQSLLQERALGQTFVTTAPTALASQGFVFVLLQSIPHLWNAT
ncbi:hypothetical protein RRG08_059621 [Elysia crispata]|uniref:Uncharacterized protein n=1 Tax=Elysia crispata TaxID=231223 RepID=A0AAE1D4C7_9GAST|nr:hypothetical protein RRG08_059621 [Elysia crispata]